MGNVIKIDFTRKGGSEELYKAASKKRGGEGGLRAFRPDQKGAPQAEESEEDKPPPSIFLRVLAAAKAEKVGLVPVLKDHRRTYMTRDGIELTPEEVDDLVDLEKGE